MFDNATQLIESYVKVRNEFSEKMKVELKVIFDKFFEENPTVKAITWEQYTPYFQDGDPCEFSVYDVAFCNFDDDDELNNVHYGEYDVTKEESEKTGYAAFTSNASFDPSWTSRTEIEFGETVDLETAKKLGNLIQSNEMEPVLESIFGDHVKVYVTPEKMWTTEYDHE